MLKTSYLLCFLFLVNNTIQMSLGRIDSGKSVHDNKYYIKQKGSQKYSKPFEKQSSSSQNNRRRSYKYIDNDDSHKEQKNYVNKKTNYKNNKNQDYGKTNIRYKCRKNDHKLTNEEKEFEEEKISYLNQRTYFLIKWLLLRFSKCKIYYFRTFEIQYMRAIKNMGKQQHLTYQTQNMFHKFILRMFYLRIRIITMISLNFPKKFNQHMEYYWLYLFYHEQFRRNLIQENMELNDSDIRNQHYLHKTINKFKEMDYYKGKKIFTLNDYDDFYSWNLEKKSKFFQPMEEIEQIYEHFIVYLYEQNSKLHQEQILKEENLVVFLQEIFKNCSINSSKINYIQRFLVQILQQKDNIQEDELKKLFMKIYIIVYSENDDMMNNMIFICHMFQSFKLLYNKSYSKKDYQKQLVEAMSMFISESNEISNDFIITLQKFYLRFIIIIRKTNRTDLQKESDNNLYDEEAISYLNQNQEKIDDEQLLGKEEHQKYLMQKQQIENQGKELEEIDEQIQILLKYIQKEEDDKNVVVEEIYQNQQPQVTSEVYEKKKPQITYEIYEEKHPEVHEEIYQKKKPIVEEIYHEKKQPKIVEHITEGESPEVIYEIIKGEKPEVHEKYYEGEHPQVEEYIKYSKNPKVNEHYQKGEVLVRDKIIEKKRPEIYNEEIKHGTINSGEEILHEQKIGVKEHIDGDSRVKVNEKIIYVDPNEDVNEEIREAKIKLKKNGDDDFEVVHYKEPHLDFDTTTKQSDVDFHPEIQSKQNLDLEVQHHGKNDVEFKEGQQKNGDVNFEVDDRGENHLDIDYKTKNGNIDLDVVHQEQPDIDLRVKQGRNNDMDLDVKQGRNPDVIMSVKQRRQSNVDLDVHEDRRDSDLDMRVRHDKNDNDVNINVVRDRKGSDINVGVQHDPKQSDVIIYHDDQDRDCFYVLKDYDRFVKTNHKIDRKYQNYTIEKDQDSKIYDLIQKMIFYKKKSEINPKTKRNQELIIAVEQLHQNPTKFIKQVKDDQCNVKYLYQLILGEVYQYDLQISFDKVLEQLLKAKFDEKIFDLYEFLSRKQFKYLFANINKITRSKYCPEKIQYHLQHYYYLYEEVIDVWYSVLIDLNRNILLQQNFYSIMIVFQDFIHTLQQEKNFKKLFWNLYYRYLFIEDQLRNISETISNLISIEYYIIQSRNHIINSTVFQDLYLSITEKKFRDIIDDQYVEKLVLKSQIFNKIYFTQKPVEFNHYKLQVSEKNGRIILSKPKRPKNAKLEFISPQKIEYEMLELNSPERPQYYELNLLTPIRPKERILNLQMPIRPIYQELKLQEVVRPVYMEIVVEIEDEHHQVEIESPDAPNLKKISLKKPRYSHSHLQKIFNQKPPTVHRQRINLGEISAPRLQKILKQAPRLSMNNVLSNIHKYIPRNSLHNSFIKRKNHNSHNDEQLQVGSSLADLDKQTQNN